MMTPTDTTDATAPSLAERAQALRDSIVSRVDDIAGSGKAMIADRRDGRRRDELLRELGELHYGAAAADVTVDAALTDRLVAEIRDLEEEPS